VKKFDLSGVPRWQSLKVRVTLFTLAIFMMGTWALLQYNGELLRKDSERLLIRQPCSTALAMTDQVNCMATMVNR
jgi:hypothetical protein